MISAPKILTFLKELKRQLKDGDAPGAYAKVCQAIIMLEKKEAENA